MRRSAWIDQPLSADVPKLKKHLITEAVFDGRWLSQQPDPKAYLQGVKDALGSSGAFFAAQGSDSLGQWPGPQTGATGAQWADYVYDMFQKHIAPGTSGNWPVVHLNPENDDLHWQTSMWARWRARSPRRLTVWSPVCHKWEIYRPVAAALIASNLIVAPQCYVGNMERVESANELAGWESIGIPRERICPFLDGAVLGHWWGEIGGAIVFTQGRLP